MILQALPSWLIHMRKPLPHLETLSEIAGYTSQAADF